MTSCKVARSDAALFAGSDFSNRGSLEPESTLVVIVYVCIAGRGVSSEPCAITIELSESGSRCENVTVQIIKPCLWVHGLSDERPSVNPRIDKGAPLSFEAIVLPKFILGRTGPP